MFLRFFYYLRAHQFNAALDEWLLLLEALNRDCACSLLDFYTLCRCILVKSESHLDQFDLLFFDFFSGASEALSPEMEKQLNIWLNTPALRQSEADPDKAYEAGFLNYRTVEQMLEERKREQKELHNGGCYWIGTVGSSVFGNTGLPENGVRMGGKSMKNRALYVAGERNYRDFREDTILNIRQYQMAFRRLRQLTSRLDAPRAELDIDQSIDQTCRNGGSLKLVFQRPRKNAVKLLLLMDCGGSMEPYSALCTTLFQAVSASNHFSDLKIYYFHNCVYSKLFTKPTCRWGDWIETETLMRTLSDRYCVLIMGDAAMADEELLEGNRYPAGARDSVPGIEWIRRLKRKYTRLVWLNPTEMTASSYYYGNETRVILEKEVDMYLFNLNGLDMALRHLLRASDGK